MSKKHEQNTQNPYFSEEMANSKFLITEDGMEYIPLQTEDMSMWDRFHASLQDYMARSKMMLLSSLNHLRAPSTIIVLIGLIAVYILLTAGQAGIIEFSFRGAKKVIQYITTNLDVIVNALLGFFYGPVVCCIGFSLCTIIRMIVENMSVYVGYIIASVVAGFLHGWILYRHKTVWFGTRFRGFFTDLLVKVFMTRLIISVFVNIFLMAVIHRIFIKYPIMEFIMHYSKSGEKLNSIAEVLSVFTVSVIFETIIVFIALAVINFIVGKAFPVQEQQPALIIDDDGNLINPEDEMMQNASHEDMM